MQTFLPYPDYALTATVLDRQRLGKQRVEVLQILRAPQGNGGGWVNHPAVRMWRGHEGSLICYGLAICKEWVSRGYQDTCKSKIADFSNMFPCYESAPEWFGDPDFHRAHRSNLIRKAPAHYKTLWPDVPDDLPYIWPVPL